MITDFKNFVFINRCSFFDGFLHDSYADATKNYSKKVQNNVLVKSLTIMPIAPKTSYYLGRSVRFLLAIPGTVLDIILQLFQCATFSFEILINKIDKASTGKMDKDTYLVNYPITKLFIKLRDLTTTKEPWILAKDMRIKDKLTKNLKRHNSRQIGLICEVYCFFLCKIGLPPMNK